MFIALIVMVLCSCSLAEDPFVNEFDQPVFFVCPAGKSISAVASVHSNKYEDRRFAFKCQPTPGLKPGHCKAYYKVNELDKFFRFKCPDNSVISGIRSYHNNKAEDRNFSFLCCPVSAKLTDCRPSGPVNKYDETFKSNVPKGRYLTGVASVHSNRFQDRQYSFWTCKMA